MQYMQNISKYADWLKQSTPRFVVPLAMFVHLDTGPILNINEQEPNIVFQVEGETLLIQWWGRQVGSLCPSCLAQVRLFFIQTDFQIYFCEISDCSSRDDFRSSSYKLFFVQEQRSSTFKAVAWSYCKNYPQNTSQDNFNFFSGPWRCSF